MNAAGAKAMPGVINVFEMSTGVAVVAETFWQAKQAAAKVEVQWESMPLEAVDTDTLRRITPRRWMPVTALRAQRRRHMPISA